MEEKEVILLRETPLESVVSDAGTFCIFCGLIGIGVLVDSTALQWVGAVIAFLVVIGRTNDRRKRSTLTIKQARARLDELEQSNG